MSEENLYMVYGGEMQELHRREFKDLSQVEVVGLFKDYDEARKAWRGAAQRTVDNAHMRFFIVKVEDVKKVDPSKDE